MDPAQPRTTAGEELDDVDDDLSSLSVRGMKESQESFDSPLFLEKSGRKNRPRGRVIFLRVSIRYA